MKNIRRHHKQYYGKQTALAVKNFPFATPQVHLEFIHAIAQIKEATALANASAGNIDARFAKAIARAAREVQHAKFDDQFVLPGIQGGAGTSIHMNVNEVIATRANELLGLSNGASIHSNDHVNRGQSTNDVNPSAIKIAAIPLTKALIKTLDEAQRAFELKAKEFHGLKKLGRTHLQDAVPTTYGAVFSSYAAVIGRGKMRIEQVLPYLYELNLGGTAVGNSVNASPAYRQAAYKHLKKITRLPLKPAGNLMSQTSSQTDFLALSQALVATMTDFSKLASDIRLLASGPNGGLGELVLPELQPGSSIMPGKVNPILAEAMNQAYYTISGNNLTIEHAVHGAQLELGVMLPVIADRLIGSLKLAHDVITVFSRGYIAQIQVNERRTREHLERSTAYATMLTPTYGYEYISKLVKEANKAGKSMQAVLKEHGIAFEPGVPVTHS